jgi:hypothetical protein
VDAATFRRGFDLMGLQRHIKVLGIFCRLWYRDGKAGYLRDLPLVWKYTRDVGRRYPETAPLVALIEARSATATSPSPPPDARADLRRRQGRAHAPAHRNHAQALLQAGGKPWSPGTWRNWPRSA